MTRQEIAAKLREALRLMNDTGRHWFQGDYQAEIEYDEETNASVYAYCSLGAIRYVVGDDVEDPSPQSAHIALALAEVLPETDGEARGLFTEPDAIAYDRIVTWNDKDERTWDEIVEKFTEVADSLERSAR